MYVDTSPGKNISQRVALAKGMHVYRLGTAALCTSRIIVIVCLYMALNTAFNMNG